MEEKLNQLPLSELEKFCKQYGLWTGQSRREMIEHSLIVKEYEIRYNKETKVEITAKLEFEKKTVDVNVDFVKNVMKNVNSKQGSYSLQELEKMISDGMELVKFMEKRNEVILEKDDNGVALDELDYAFFDLPKGESEVNIAGLPDDAVLDGTPLNEEERKQLRALNLVMNR
jgi:hypothetical protein